MGGRVSLLQQQGLERGIDVTGLAARLDRADVLLLKEFYVAEAGPCGTDSHVLRLLAERLRLGKGPLGRLSYGAIRHRLENLVALGLLGRIPRTNPAVYYPLDWATGPVRKIMLLVAADFVGVWNASDGGAP